jgi:hypothetical protein
LDSQKGSVSFDFVFASLIFIIILGFSIVAYSNNIEQIKNNNIKNKAESDVLSISRILVKTSGNPTYGEDDPGNVQVIGLADSENILSIEKVNAFSSLSVNETKDALGITNDFFIQIKSIEGIEYFSKGSEQVNTSSVSIERIVYFNQTISRLVVRLYE